MNEQQYHYSTEDETGAQLRVATERAWNCYMPCWVIVILFGERYLLITDAV